MDRDALLALAERVEKAEGPERELDHAIIQAVYPGIGKPSIWIVGDEEPIYWNDPLYKKAAPYLTRSLDAAVAFVSEMLPGWGIHLSIWRVDDRSTVKLYDSKSVRTSSEVEAATPPLALMAAVLRALAGEAGHG